MWTFDTGVNGWSATNPALLGAVHAPALAGHGSLAIHNAGIGSATLVASSGSSSKTWTPARPATRWFGRVSVHAKSHSRALHVTVAFLNRYGNRIDQAAGQGALDSTRDWRPTYTAVGIAPPGTAYVVLRVTFEKVGTDETHYIDNAGLAEYPAGAHDVVGPLQTSGTSILDGNGNTLVLRGFTRVGLEGGDAAPPSADDIAHAKLWGANVIRLPLGEQFWLSTSCNYRPNYKAQVDNAVRIVTGMGMVAMLDLHWNSIRRCGAFSQQPMADYPGSVNFWQQVAARYKNNPLVSFDLYNEPHDISDAVWRSGGLIRWKGTAYRAAGMQQLYDAVRSTGAQNLVFVSGNSWANLWPSTAPLSASNIVYGIHVYTCPTDPPPHCTNPAPYSPGQFFQFWGSASLRYPVAVTEFGWPNPADGRYMAAVIAYAERQGWSWTAFTWGSASWGPFSLLANAGPGAAYEPTPGGEAVLAAFPGG